MLKKYSYPPQMASIGKNDWRLQDYINREFSQKELQKTENELWKQIEKIAKEAKAPPNENVEFSSSKLLGYGWEWAVYGLPSSDRVLKVPAGIFKEVNEAEYLDNTRVAYKVCKKYLNDFVLDTNFKRIETKDGRLNTINQRKIKEDEISFVDPINIKSDLGRQLVNLGRALLVMLQEEQWLPDFHLWRKMENGKKGWNIWNLFIEKEKPVVFDFTVYYDVWRLYPQRTEEETKIKGKNWRDFISELSN